MVPALFRDYLTSPKTLEIKTGHRDSPQGRQAVERIDDLESLELPTRPPSP
jgi:hypothetical protein